MATIADVGASMRILVDKLERAKKSQSSPSKLRLLIEAREAIALAKRDFVVLAQDEQRLVAASMNAMTALLPELDTLIAHTQKRAAS